ncbi:hypothetical protein FSP39_014009 [Pinctada imbricata]|uniref:C17orf113 probable zinc finger domain-containing protein n=1 Tax=Pinctada imbricata TaxID=66713 RepID=A0AA88YAW8_PINIB|nr:hypothetical protein FSP39_014009 [Pinctada imbricata]
MDGAWAFLSGYNKKGENKTKKRAYDQTYEKTKRVRTFKDSWAKDRPWLKDSERGMTCDLCIRHQKGVSKNTFLTGCTARKLDSIIKHENSEGHKRAVEIDINSNKACVCETRMPPVASLLV